MLKKLNLNFCSQKWIKKTYLQLILTVFFGVCSLFHWIFRLNCTRQCNSGNAIGPKNPVKQQTPKHGEKHEPKFRFNLNFFNVHRSQYFISNSDWLSRLVSSSSNAKVTHHLWPVKYFRLVFTRNGVRVKIVSRVKRVLMALWKSKIRVVSRVMSVTDCWSWKNHNVSVFFWLRLWLCCLRSSENQIVRVGTRGGRINQSQSLWLV